MSRRRDRGVVLLLVMGAVVLLVAVAVELASRAKVDVMLSARLSREAAFRRLGDSGVEVGRGLLVEPEASGYDFWGEPWQGGAQFTLGPEEKVVVRVADESGKLNIVKERDPERLRRTLDRLFEYLLRYEKGGRPNLKDVRAAVFHRLGILEPVAEGEKPPVPEPLLTLDGLREAGLSLEEVFSAHGLHRYLTTFGDGKVNLNTAPRAVLYALDDEMDAATVDQIARYRGDPDGEKGVYKPFEEPKDLRLVDGIVERSVQDGQVRVVRDLYQRVSGRVTTRSTAFSIQVEARIGERVRQAWAFFEPGRTERVGEGPRRTLRRLAFEEVRP